MDYRDSKVAVVGFGEEGRSATSYFLERGAEVTIFDKDQTRQNELPIGVRFIADTSDLSRLTNYDFVCRSPAIRPDRLPTGANVTTVSKEFFRVCPAPIIGVTGTKGKGTTAALISHMLEAAGFKTHLLGNIGLPALDVITEIESSDVVVYELSSFQLWDMKQSPHIAVVLMISEDHMDVHRSMDEYVAAKANIARHQLPDDVVVYHPTNPYSRQIAEQALSKHIRYMHPEGARVEADHIVIDSQKICRVGEVGLIGRHNLENVCAAVTAAWQFSQDATKLGQAVRAFKGLEHRLEFVAQVRGVDYYNDSFSTTVPAAVAAIEAFDKPKIIILGGSDKGADYRQLAAACRKNGVKKALLIGQTAPAIAAALDSEQFTDYEFIDKGDMNTFVSRASDIASNGDVVLLSPACASFGLFDSYKQRGRMFKEAVKAL